MAAVRRRRAGMGAIMMMEMMGSMESRLGLRSAYKILIDPIFMCWIVAFIFFDSGPEYQLESFYHPFLVNIKIVHFYYSQGYISCPFDFIV